MLNREPLKSFKTNITSSAVYKYFGFRLKLAVAQLGDLRDQLDHATPPVPPAEIRCRVHGSLDKESFLRAGRTISQNIRDLCTIAGRELYSFENVLDFGCGCGRVLSNFQDTPGSCRFYGTDIDSESVRWCEKNLPHVLWSTNSYQPPLPFADNTFDLIFAISVFTHLDQDYQHTWLRELQRIAKPGGLVILTVQGEYSISQLAPAVQVQIHSNGFMFVTGTTGLLKLDKLPDFYQIAYHTREYIQREWSAYFDVFRYVERGINNHQDAVLLRNR